MDYKRVKNRLFQKERIFDGKMIASVVEETARRAEKVKKLLGNSQEALEI